MLKKLVIYLHVHFTFLYPGTCTFTTCWWYTCTGCVLSTAVVQQYTAKTRKLFPNIIFHNNATANIPSWYMFMRHASTY